MLLRAAASMLPQEPRLGAFAAAGALLTVVFAMSWVVLDRGVRADWRKLTARGPAGRTGGSEGA